MWKINNNTCLYCLKVVFELFASTDNDLETNLCVVKWYNSKGKSC